MSRTKWDGATVLNWQDIDYAARLAIGEYNDSYVDLEVFQIAGYDDAGLLYMNDVDSFDDRFVRSIADASVYLSGSIKWDGCANLHFDNQDSAMLHFCGKRDATNIGVLLGRLYDAARDILPHPDW